MHAQTTSNHRLSGRRVGSGFSLVELLVVVAVIGILAGLFIGSLRRATSFAKSAACKNNLRQQGLALAMYAGDFHRYPLSRDPRVPVDVIGSDQQLIVLSAWAKVLKPYVNIQRRSLSDGRAFLCPEKERINAPDARTSLASVAPSAARMLRLNLPYGYNAYGTALNVPTLNLGLGKEFNPSTGMAETDEVAESKVVSPADMIAIGDSSGLTGLLSPVFSARSPVESLDLLPARRHAKEANMAFGDGHVEQRSFKEWTEPTDAARRRWNNDNEPHRETWR